MLNVVCTKGVDPKTLLRDDNPLGDEAKNGQTLGHGACPGRVVDPAHFLSFHCYLLQVTSPTLPKSGVL